MMLIHGDMMLVYRMPRYERRKANKSIVSKMLNAMPSVAVSKVHSKVVPS